MSNNSTHIRIQPKKVAAILLTIVLLLVLASIIGQLLRFLKGHDFIYGFVPFFDLDSEQNIPTYFSSAMLLFLAFLLGTIAALKKRKPYAHYWLFLAMTAAYLSIDEMICIHESWIEPMQGMFSAKGIFYFAWVIPAIPLILVFVLFFRRFFLHLPEKTKHLFTIAVILYLGGGLGFEFIGGWYSSQYGELNLPYVFITTAEETLEMIGIVVLIYGLMEYIRTDLKEILFRIEEKPRG